mgnify:CR=1 FL=1
MFDCNSTYPIEPGLPYENVLDFVPQSGTASPVRIQLRHASEIPDSQLRRSLHFLQVIYSLCGLTRRKGAYIVMTDDEGLPGAFEGAEVDGHDHRLKNED